MNKQERMEYLVERLNLASEAYYGGKPEIMSNYEWDAMFDELTKLEEETGIVLENSPTHNVSGAESEVENGAGVREAHEFPTLSLAKTKRVEDLQSWAGDREIWLTWKLDGLTLVLTYDGGKLSKIVTRGRDGIGTNITYMKDAIKGFPKKIPYKGHLVVRGEALILYSDFEKINAYAGEGDDKYANPRNLASGTLALDPSNIDIVKERNLKFYAFTPVYMEEPVVSWGARVQMLDDWGFTTVERKKTDAPGIAGVVAEWTHRVEKGEVDTPVDGLVICYDDTEYAATGSVTGHHATRAGLAFKWQDEIAVTILDHVEWSCGASVITPVAVFEPVQLEGTSVSRASLCNISEMERLGIGEDGKTTVQVIKANKIIPKCVGVVEKEGVFAIPEACPVCQAPTEVWGQGEGETKTLHCTNPECPAKKLRIFARFVGRQGMDIDGMSIKTMLRFINEGFVTNYESIYALEKHADSIRQMEGFGEKSCANLLKAIEKSKKVSPINFIYALNIPLIGIDAAKKIINAIGYEAFVERAKNGDAFDDVDGIGGEKSNGIVEWFSNENHRRSFDVLNEMLDIEKIEPAKAEGGTCEGLGFVITGDVHEFANRAQFTAYIEKQGGRVAGSVSKKTNYLINNDVESTSSKNKKAKSLGVPIISEGEFIERFGKE